jgi:hypothetical protein
MSDMTFLNPMMRGNSLAHTILRAVDDCDPHGIPRPEERRTRHYFVDPATDRQVVVNVWPSGELDAAFESEPGVFGVPVPVRRTESEIVG